MAKILACHFLQADMLPRVGHESKPWTVGETRAVTGRLALCSRGYHYSPTWKDAFSGNYLYGPMACVVEVDDDGPKDESKGCSRTRTLVEVFNVEREMRLFAADEATGALKTWEKRSGKVADVRSWAAVKAARAFADGKITPEKLAAASDAASDAAWAAASAAAWAAASARFAAAMGKATGWYDV